MLNETHTQHRARAVEQTGQQAAYWVTALALDIC